MAFQIREMEINDWERVRDIYQQGMDSNTATFETNCPNYEKFDSSHVKSCRFVIAENDTVVGWVALSPVSSRCVYAGVADLSIYIDEKYKGKGAGTQLLAHMIEKSEPQGFWMLQSVILQNNLASIRLHEKCGFRLVGFREKIGKDRFGQWHNTVLMEKRSQQAQFN